MAAGKVRYSTQKFPGRFAKTLVVLSWKALAGPLPGEEDFHRLMISS